MVNKGDTLLKKERYLDALLKEGKRCLAMMQEMYDCCKTESNLYKKLLFAMDRYSRYKTQVREDMEELKEMFEEIDDMVDEDEESDEEIDDEDDFVPIELEDFEEQNVEEEEEEEEEDFVLEEQIRYFHNIIHRKNALANLEMILLRLLDIDAKLMSLQLSIYSKLKIYLKEYCGKVRVVLKRSVNFMKSVNNFKGRQLAQRTLNKYRKLQQLLTDLIEVRLIMYKDVLTGMLRNFTIFKSGNNMYIEFLFF
nr:uncharacterized protein LOC117610498 isoform X1 [Osmia lignaria]